MIPYQIDPSLHPAQPSAPQLDDGFSPPASSAQDPRAVQLHPQPAPVLPAKSDF